MAEFLVHIIISAVVLLLTAKVVKGLQIDNFGYAVVGALVFGAVNAVIKPLTVFLTLPLTIITLGLFLLVVNALMLMLVAAISPGIRVLSFWSALIAALLISLLNIVISILFGWA